MFTFVDDLVRLLHASETFSLNLCTLTLSCLNYLYSYKVSSENLDSECSIDSEDSDLLDVFFSPDYNIEDARESPLSPSEREESLDSCDMAYAFEPLADEELIKLYEKEVKENEELKRMLEKKLNGTETVDSWTIRNIHTFLAFRLL